MSLDTTQAEIVAECDALKTLLLEKNRAYGDSALDPVRIFSKADTVEQILVRIDDKLSRLKRGSAAGEDVEHDLLGYLILLRIARRRQASPEVEREAPKADRPGVWVDPLFIPAGEVVRVTAHHNVPEALVSLLARVVGTAGPNIARIKFINGEPAGNEYLLPCAALEPA